LYSSYMAINILFFGQLRDITNNNTLTLNNVPDTDSLMQQLKKSYPSLAGYPYLIAVDKELISSNTTLSDNCTVALLPPYAGG